MNYTATVINEISEDGAMRVKNYVVSNILNDTFIFNIKQPDNTIKKMRLSELVEQYDTYPQ